MKFAVALTLATTAMAGIVARDATVVKAVIETAGTDIDAVKSAVDAYKGDKTNLVSAADKLVSDLKEGKSKVEAGPELTLSDAVTLGSAVNDLAAKGGKLTDSLDARKSDVEKAGECKTVQDQISAISSASNDLIKSVVGKVPENAQSIAQQLADQLTVVLKKAEDSYKDCKNSGGSGSSTGSATPTGTGSATPTGTGSATGTVTTKPTGSATATHGTTTDCPPSATGTGTPKPTSSGPVTVPTGAAAIYAPAGVLAAVAAALAL